MMNMRGAIRRGGSLAVVAILTGCSAPTGYHYEAVGAKLVSNDPCASARVSSAVTIRALNAKAGHPGGPPSAVLALRDPKAPHDIGERPQDLLCHATLAMRDGKTQSGFLSLTNRGRGAPMEVSWQSDRQLSQKVDAQDKKEEAQAKELARRGQKCERDAKEQIPIILGLGQNPRIAKISEMANESVDGRIRCSLRLHWSNGLIEGGVFREWRNDYGKLMVGWQRNYAIPPRR